MASVMGPAEPTVQNTEEQLEAVRTIHEWYEKDRDAKEFYVREMDENDKLYKSKHWDLIGPDGKPLRDKSQQALRPNAVENITFSLIAGTVSEFSQNVDIVDFPVEQTDEEAANVMTDLKEYIADKNHITEERIKWLWDFFLHGTGIWEVTWDPSWRGGRGPNRWLGEIRWRRVHPRAIFPDARCGEDINRGRRIHKVAYVPKEYVKERFPEYGELARESSYDEKLVGSYEHTVADVQEDRVLLIETWYFGEPLVTKDGEGAKGSGLHVIWWAGDENPVYLDSANYLYFADGEQPSFPFIFRQRYPRDGSVWGYGEAYYLKQPQVIHNKTIEILTEGHVHSALGQGFYEPGALDSKQQKDLQARGTLPGMWFAANNIDRVKRIYGQSMPSSLLQEAQRGPKMMEQIMGRFDISQGRTPGSVTAFQALDLLAQRAQVRLRSADVAITSAYQEVGGWINRLVWLHYTERRAYRVIGQNEKGFILRSQGVFELDKYRKVYDFNSGTIVQASEFQPPEGYVEGTDYEVYAPDLDVRCRTSQQMPSDRMFYMEVAKELYSARLIDPETFFDVIDDGKFPPWETVKNRLMQYTAQQAVAQSGVPGQQVAGGQANSNPDPQALVESLIESLDDDSLARLNALPPEDQNQIVQQMLQNAQGSPTV